MAHQRTTSTVAADALKEPHSISLKVLRLSRPSFAVQHPLPSPSLPSNLAQSIKSAASLAYPSKAPPDSSETFILSPLLTLPPAFGNAYVGETFACTLCANNELSVDTEPARCISGVRIEAEMKTPTLTASLDVSFALNRSNNPLEEGFKKDKSEDDIQDEQILNGHDLASGQSLQGIVNYDLKEEGSHVLAVTISYTETGATSGKVRSFRKLYQFVARACLVVRTKIGSFPDAITRSFTSGQKAEAVVRRKRWSVEAQLENCGEEIIMLDIVDFDEKPWCKATSLNWSVGQDGSVGDEAQNPMLAPKDVQQVCFLVEQKNEDTEPEIEASGRVVMGMLSITWRGPMGNKGTLSTGWLGTKFR